MVYRYNTDMLCCTKASSDRRQIDIGANLFVGNLDINVDESVLYTAFSNFGALVQPAKVCDQLTGSSSITQEKIKLTLILSPDQIQRDEQGQSRGFGFVAFDSFEAADAAIEAMNNQFLMNKAVTVQYAFKKDSAGERHGTEAERLLAQQARKNGAMAMMSAPPPPSFLTGANAAGAPTAPPPGYQGQQQQYQQQQPQYQQQQQPAYPGYPPQQQQYAQYPGQQQGYGTPTGQHMPPPPAGFQAPPNGFMPPPPVGFR